MSKNGLILLTPTSIAYTGTSATISANGSVLFSAISQLRLNGVFSADYDNYIIVARTGDSTNSNFQCRLSVGGVDNSTANSYTRQYIQADSTTISGGRASADINFLHNTSTVKGGFISNIYGPFLVQPTAFRSVTADGGNTGFRITDLASTHNQSTSYDGINFIIASGTSSGRVAVYGMRK